MSEKYDFSKYPEGFERFCSLLEDLPDDENVRGAFAEGVMGFVITL